MGSSQAASPLPPPRTTEPTAPHAGSSEDGRFTNRLNKNNPSHFVPRYQNRAQWEARAAALRRQVLVSLGMWPTWPKTPMNPVVHGRVDRDGYSIEKVFFASVPGHYVTGNLYRPSGRTAQKLPAILRPYGHWPNGRFIWRTPEEIEKELTIGAEVSADAAKSPQQASCAMLARMGCVVFQFDMVGYCDSKKIPHKEGFLDAEAALRGENFMVLQTWNSVRAMDFVLGLADVDERRVGCTGSSQGGMQSFALSSLDDRLAAMFLVCSVSMTMQGGCVCGNTPLLRIGSNNVEFAAMFAPKPLGIAAAHDWTQNFEKLGLPEMRSIYRLYGATDQISAKTFPYPHNFNLHSREMMYDFFNRQFNLGWESPVKELPFVPMPPAELSVFDAAHPEPADSTDAAGVRKWMRRLSDGQMADLEKRPPEWAATVGAALSEMVGDKLPSPNEIEILEGGSIRQPLWHGCIRRTGTNERIAASTLFPANWDGAIVVWSHPEGVDSLRDTDPAVRKILDHRSAIIAADVFRSGSFFPLQEQPPFAFPAGKVPTAIDMYVGMSICYERTPIANRAHDLLSVIALAQAIPNAKSLSLAAFGVAGPSALVALALAGKAIDRAVIDLNQFDFDQIKDAWDPMLLPAALKYGGIGAIARLCNSATGLCNARRNYPLVPPAVSVSTDAKSPAEMIEWLIGA